MDEATRLIRSGVLPTNLPRTVGPPIQRGSTVLMPTASDLYDDDQITYGLEGLSAHMALRDGLAQLEGAASVTLYPSGLAAMTGALLALLKAGDEVLLNDSAYAPTGRFCDNVLKRFGVTTRYYPPNASADEIAALFTPATRLVVLEAPASLTFEMQDIPAIAAACRAAGIWSLMDNTWAAGLCFKPLANGVDVSMQALTKYVGGHSDTFMGSICVNDPVLSRKLNAAWRELGWGVSPEDAWIMLRGLRTLPVRLQRHGENGLAVARWLAAQPQVLQVLHPALEGAPGHDLWTRDFSGASGLFAFVLQARPERSVHALLEALTLFGLGFSWGGYESLAVNCDPQFGKRRFKPAFEGPVIRLSVGLESPADLIDDLAKGLAAYDA